MTILMDSEQFLGRLAHLPDLVAQLESKVAALEAALGAHQAFAADESLDVKGAAKLLSKSAGAVYQLHRRGVIKGFYIGRTLRFRRADLIPRP